MKLAIYEDDARTGNVDLDERTYEYSGSSPELRELLDRMESGEITQLQPVADDDASESELIPDEDEADHRPGMEERAIEGKALGRHLRQSVKSIATDDTPMRVEAVDGSLEAETISLVDDDSETNESESVSASDRKAIRYGPPSGDE